MIIKVISLWQPWAEAMRRLLKKNETRSWYTSHRGWLGIHAAKKEYRPRDYDFDFNLGVQRRGSWGDGIWPHHLPTTYGTLRCIVWMTDCLKTETALEHLSAPEKFWGNYEPGRFAWITDSTKHITLAKPVPLTGRQGLFDWELPPEIEALLPKQEFALEVQ